MIWNFWGPGRGGVEGGGGGGRALLEGEWGAIGAIPEGL